MKRLLFAVLLALALAAPAAAGSRETAIRAQLAPVAPAASGSGLFTAKATTAQTAVTLRWQLSVTHLSGPATRARLLVSGSGISIALCKPCSARAHGALQLVGPFWKSLVAKGAKVFVDTRAHPKGELRGVVKTG